MSVLLGIALYPPLELSWREGRPFTVASSRKSLVTFGTSDSKIDVTSPWSTANGFGRALRKRSIVEGDESAECDGNRRSWIGHGL